MVYINSFSDPQGGLSRHLGHLEWPLQMLSKDAAKSMRVMKAMMQMDKLDIKGLEQAALQ
ncbi:MAG: hypothetical protein ABI728_05280 [Betaproteobacteria bacterium]